MRTKELKIFTIKTINPMSYDEEWGQSFWATTHEQEMPVKFTKQIKYTPAIESKITSEEHEIKPGKKGEFMALYGVKLEDTGKNQPTQTTIVPPNDIIKILEIIDSKLDGILDKLDPPVKDFDEPEQEDTTD